ncbi:MAG: retroviral-like aspartic protease family protein [Bacteroidia bacterium]|nr:retroviral-like aspartic protease family protein [Bacteroidia bacterium]MBT8268674.1 retroviral-like aspartic protease family protein [Bacteroidia bacterium]NNF82623.1 clan AA aspartic protease [Flavobacteriaceae bacterium]NNK70417.1 clan AA aspartic protease [Flavobacteriaceae bacterium]NNL80123.1 clan AA aspartic protease [Flavobacteriaceae bacterium]
MKLNNFLKKRKYTKIKLKRLKSNHFALKATINGVKGQFILDTGASNTLVHDEHAKLFKLEVDNNEDVKVTGAGAENMDSQVSKKNALKIGKWSQSKTVIVLFNLSHVNSGLNNFDIDPIDGIIGTDILKKGKAIIDYNKKHLYLKLP